MDLSTLVLGSVFGDCLKKLLPKELKKYSDRVVGLLLFVNDGHHVWFCKYHNREDLKTDNTVMTEKWFTNSVTNI